MKIDLHTHSIMSGHAYSTISEMAAGAAERGLEYLAITEHGPAGLGSVGLSYFGNIHRMPKVLSGVRMLSGVEANVINSKGEIDLPEQVLERLDVVVAGFHENTGYVDQGIEKNTEAAIEAMKNPHVKIMSHPYAMYFDFDLGKIVDASIEHNVMIELNASYLEGSRIKDEKIFNNLKETMRLLKAAGRKVVLTSDAHSHEEVGDFKKAISMLDELGLTEDDILNNDVGAVLDFLGVEK